MGYKILLADDSVTVQKIVTLTFSDEGVDVVPVNSGDEAINRLNYMHPALVMADVSLPGKNGYEICEFVKSHPELKNTPVILLVPAFEPFDEERAARVGADHHLTKPFQSIRTLIATVKNLIEPAAKAVTPPIVWPTTNPPAGAVKTENGVAAEAEKPRNVAPTTADLLPLINLSAAESSAVKPVAGSLFDAPSVLNLSGLTAALNPTPLVSAPLEGDILDLDDVLELDDVLAPASAPAPAPLVVASPQVLAPAAPVANTITQSVKLTSLEAITTTSIPQSVVDEIASRVTAQVTTQLSSQFSQFAAQLFDHLTVRLAQDLAPRIANEVLARLDQPVTPPPPTPEVVDSVLDI